MFKRIKVARDNIYTSMNLMALYARQFGSQQNYGTNNMP